MIGAGGARFVARGGALRTSAGVTPSGDSRSVGCDRRWMRSGRPTETAGRSNTDALSFGEETSPSNGVDFV